MMYMIYRPETREGITIEREKMSKIIGGGGEGIWLTRILSPCSHASKLLQMSTHIIYLRLQQVWEAWEAYRAVSGEVQAGGG
jgi:hypothetical protein